MKLWMIIIVLFIIFLFPLFHTGIYISHDGDVQIARFAAYFTALQDGQFPPRWAGNLNFGYGTPLFIFYYPFPGYVASLLHLVGLSFTATFKLLMGLSFLASFVTFYLWARTLFQKNTAVLGAFLYGLAPYHFLNLYVRGDVGEMVAFALTPLVFWSIEKTFQTKKLPYLFLGSLFYGLHVLSHNGVSLMFTPVSLLYGILQSHNKKNLLRLLLLIGIGFLVSSFFWVPALVEGKYVNAHLFIGDMYKNNFLSLTQFIVSKWGFGADVSKPGGLSPQIGLLYSLFVLASIVVWIKTKKEKKLFSMWIAAFFLSLFITLPFSSIAWSHVSLLRLYEFPWRFVGFASFSAVVLACYVLDTIRDKKSLIVIGVVLLVTSIFLVRVNGYTSQNDNYYTSFTGTTYFHGEASPIWTAGDPGIFAKKQIEIIDGEGSIHNVLKKTQIHTFSIYAHNKVTVLDNTLYFPGWEVLVDNHSVPIQFQDANHRGLITFIVPPGTHTVKVVFRETRIRLVTDIISLLTFCGIIVFFMVTLLYNKKELHT